MTDQSNEGATLSIEPRDTGELLEVPEDQRLDVDPDPEDVGQANEDAGTTDYGLLEGDDVDLDDITEDGGRR